MSDENPPAVFNIDNLLNVDNLPDFISALTDVLVTIGTPIIVVFVIYAGFLFVTAQGNSEKLTRAKRTLLFTLVGAAVIIGADVISDVIAGTLNDLGATTDDLGPDTPF